MAGQGDSDPVDAMTESAEPRVFDIPVCEPCIRGEGGECHSPGCSFFLFEAPPEGAGAIAQHVIEMTDHPPAMTPDEIRDEVRLRETDDPIEAFEIFVKRRVDPSLHAHFADSDENDAEFVREAIRRAIGGRTAGDAAIECATDVCTRTIGRDWHCAEHAGEADR